MNPIVLVFSISPSLPISPRPSSPSSPSLFLVLPPSSLRRVGSAPKRHRLGFALTSKQLPPRARRTGKRKKVASTTSTSTSASASLQDNCHRPGSNTQTDTRLTTTTTITTTHKHLNHSLPTPPPALPRSHPERAAMAALDFDDRQTQIDAESQPYVPYEYQSDQNESWAGALPVKQ